MSGVLKHICLELIEFNGMSTYLELFMPRYLGIMQIVHLLY